MPPKPSPPRVGDLLVARGVAPAELVARAQREARARGEPICSRLLELGVDERELVSALTEVHGVPGVDLSRSALSLDVLDTVPRAVAEGDLILPLAREGGRVHVAMARPADERAVSELRFVTGREVSAYVAVRAALLRAIGEVYELRARGAALWRGRCSASGTPHLAAVVAGAGAAVPGAGGGAIPDAELVVEVEEDPVPIPRERAAPLVLVVDDEPDIRQLVRRMLEARGLAVELASDGDEALAQAGRLVPDLVLLDAMLPKVHGFDVCRRLQASARTRHVPVIMMTAIYRGWRFAQDARESYGAHDYVEKPFRVDDLLRRVDGALRGRGGPASPHLPAPEERCVAQVARGKELIAAGQAAEAAAVLSEAARLAPGSADVQFQLGRALRGAEDRFGAMTALERAVEAAPGHLAALRALAGLYEETGFRRKAAEALERALPAAADEAARAEIRRDILRLIA